MSRTIRCAHWNKLQFQRQSETTRRSLCQRFYASHQSLYKKLSGKLPEIRIFCPQRLKEAWRTPLARNVNMDLSLEPTAYTISTRTDWIPQLCKNSLQGFMSRHLSAHSPFLRTRRPPKLWTLPQWPPPSSFEATQQKLYWLCRFKAWLTYRLPVDWLLPTALYNSIISFHLKDS